MTRIRSRREIRKAAALPKAARPSAMARWRARRAVRRDQPSWAAHPPKPKIPLADRLSSALYRPKPLKVERPGLRERITARSYIRHEGPKSPPRAPVFRGRMDKVVAGVVAGAACFVVLTWLVSKAPVPESSAQALLVQAPPAPEDDISLDEFTPPPPPRLSVSPTTSTVEPTSPVYVAPTTYEPPVTTAPPPPTTTKPPSPSPTTPSPSPTTPSPSPTVEPTPSCFPDQEPRCPTEPSPSR